MFHIISKVNLMKCLFLLILLLNGCAKNFDANSLNKTNFTEIKDEDFVQFLKLKYKNKSLWVPNTKISKENIYEYSFLSGIHFIRWQGDDSLISIFKLDKPNDKYYSYYYTFTVSPPAKSISTLGDIFNDRKLTQISIKKYNDKQGFKNLFFKMIFNKEFYEK